MIYENKFRTLLCHSPILFRYLLILDAVSLNIKDSAGSFHNSDEPANGFLYTLIPKYLTVY